MIAGKGIKKENGGMYALDEIKISYAEIVRVGPIPSSLNEQKSTKDISTGPTSPYSQTYKCSKWCGNLHVNTKSLTSNSEILNQSPIVNSKIKVTTRFEPKWIKDLKLETPHSEPKDSRCEGVIIPIKPWNKKIKVKVDHVPKTIEDWTINGPRCPENSKSRTANGPRYPEDSKSRTVNGPRCLVSDKSRTRARIDRPIGMEDGQSNQYNLRSRSRGNMLQNGRTMEIQNPISNCRFLDKSPILNCITTKTQSPISNCRALNEV